MEKPSNTIMSRNAAKGKANSRIKRSGGTDPKFSQNSFHLRPKLFNRIQIWAVRRQIKGFCSGSSKQIAYRLDMVRSEIVHDHNITRSEGGNQNIFQVVQEFVCCCAALKSCKHRCSIQTNGRQNGCGFRSAQRRVVYHPLTPFPPAITSDHIDIDAPHKHSAICY